jgi:environmental stress-induced protein Ves
MKIIIISEADYKTSTWSGGETTELFLSPPNGDYAKREFDFRLSTATVELEESDFTSLPGFERLIMSLDNPLELHHRNVDKLRVVELEPFEVDQFSGSDLTKSFGKCQWL